MENWIRPDYVQLLKSTAARDNAAAKYNSKMNFLSLLLLCTAQVVSGSSSREESGYLYGQPVPVSCLNRTIDSGEHIRDSFGRLQYIPFPICNETSAPLALRYGISETISCTIDALPDELYHLFEYYVHSDAPLTCRVPTGPLVPSILETDLESGSSTAAIGTEYDIVDVDGENSAGGPPYTPLTIALQGTLQRSHLHIWTDMNVLMHQISSIDSPRVKSKQATTAPGYVVAGTAYSVPELHNKNQVENKVSDEDAALIENARTPWTAGHGSKVIRGEPFTFQFRVTWVPGADSLGWTTSTASSSSASTFFPKIIFFAMAVGIGALAASYWERAIRSGGTGWKGDGILGRPIHHSARRGGSNSGITYGNGGRVNGYGGFFAQSNGNDNGIYAGGAGVEDGGGGEYGYGGYGKKD